jgi:1-deoxy-D-xylulose-5-phosphate reductoisomerase
MLQQCLQFRPPFAVMADSAGRARAGGAAGCRAACARACWPVTRRWNHRWQATVDTVMAAIVGAAGLASCLAAARAGKRLLLANKEALVVGGDLFLDAVKQGGATLLPIDSEHSAIFQSLPEDPSTWPDRVEKHHPHRLGRAVPHARSGQPARRHARPGLRPPELGDGPQDLGRLGDDDEQGARGDRGALPVRPGAGAPAGGDPPAERHPLDGAVPRPSVVAQLGTPDMRVPIAYGLAWPERIESGAAALDFSALADMTFESFDSRGHRQRFPGLQLAWDALARRPAPRRC